MSNIKSNLVFDFPDPSPRFDFEEPASAVKSRSKRIGGGRGFKFKHGGKAKAATGSNANVTSSNKLSSPSPDKSTATTASASSFDESAFDDSYDEVFDFGRSRQSSHTANHAAAVAVPSKPSFEFADSPSPSHRPLKLPSQSNSNSYNLHRRISSAHSNTGYISEVSEFSFDRVTVNTVETPMTGMSSNVSWNFFEETRDLVGGPMSAAANSNTGNRDDLGFVPYTGSSSSKSKNNINIRSLLENTTNNHASSSPSAAQPAAPAAQRHQIKINLDNISLSDRSNELPISGIVGSNQSVVSEISDVNMDQEEDNLNDAVKMHLQMEDEGQYRQQQHQQYHQQQTRRSGVDRNVIYASNPKSNNTNSKHRTTPPPTTTTKQPITPTSLNYSEDPSKATATTTTSPSIFQQIHHYKQQRRQYLLAKKREGAIIVNTGENANGYDIHDEENDDDDNKEEEKNVFETIVGTVCLGLGFCTWYLCGTDTTLPAAADHGEYDMFLPIYSFQFQYILYFVPFQSCCTHIVSLIPFKY